MAKAQASITISRIVDIESVTRYYLLQSSTAATPSVPTASPPGGSWVTTEPEYTSGSTNTLYFVDRTVFTNGSFSYSAVSKSSSYEAAKAAYNKAVAAANGVSEIKQTLDNITLVVVGPDGTTAEIKISDEGKITLTGDVIAQKIFAETLMAMDLTATGDFKVANGNWVMQGTDGLIKLGKVINDQLAGVKIDEGALQIRMNLEDYNTQIEVAETTVRIWAAEQVDLMVSGDAGDSGVMVLPGQLTASAGDGENDTMLKILPEKAQVVGTLTVERPGMEEAEPIYYGDYGLGTAKWLGSFDTEAELNDALDGVLAGLPSHGNARVAFLCTELVADCRWQGVVVRTSSAYGFFEGTTFGGSLYHIRKKYSGGAFSGAYWTNPPLADGVEYMLAERYRGATVYQKAFSYTLTETLGSTSSYGDVDVPHGISNFGHLVEWFSEIGSTSGYIMPYIGTGGSMTSLVRAMPGGNNLVVRSYHGTWNSGAALRFNIKYTKSG